MQAIRVHHFGGIDSLVFEEVPRPDPGEGEVLLRVKAGVLPLAEARTAHWMLAGKPHKRGKIILAVDRSQ